MDIKNSLIMPKGKFSMRANLPENEPLLIEKYKKLNIYKKLLSNRKGSKTFYLHDGPPYANNSIHAGHALNKIIKDIIIRFKNLDGYYVPYTPGWDTHGLPIELCVTKSGVDRKNVSPKEFREACREYALSQVKIQKEQMLRLGLIGDYDNPYLTLDKKYETSQLDIFASMAIKGLIYRGLKPVIWSWSSESALAEAEVEYKDVTSKSIYFTFEVKESNKYLSIGDKVLVWTTTGWTIPSNQGICFNPKLTYGLYSTNKGNVVFLESKKDEIISVCKYENVKLIETFTGRDVEKTKVKHPYQNRLVPIVVDDYVSDASGTGIVHLGPGHGADDYRIAKKYSLPIECTVDEKGYMNKYAGKEVEGQFFEDCSENVIKLLEENGNLVATHDITHAYPHDWRTKKPTIFRATTQWFCSLTKIKKELLKEANSVKYIPSWGKIRFKNMLSDRDDWCISRQRLWGVPIPIIYCEDGTPILDKKVFANIKKIFLEFGSDIWYEKDAKYFLPDGYTNPHSPKNRYTKEKDIMDVWFDSGSSFYAVNKKLKYPFPADVYFEGNDQYRGWYNSSLILSVATQNIKPYKNIITHGFIVDQYGEKFSKSKQNGIDPQSICNTFGGDILRLWTTTIDYTAAEIQLSSDLLKVCSEQYRKFRNTIKFILANLQNNDEGAYYDTSYKPTNLSNVDALMLNKLNSVIAEMKDAYNHYDFKKVSDIVNNFFVNDLSSFYLDYNKDILYCEKVDSVKRKNAQYILFNIAYKIAIAYSPILSFTCEEIYSYLNLKKKKPSITMLDYPKGTVDKNLLDEYSTLINVRNNVNKLIENIRQNNIVKQTSEVDVVYCPSSQKEKEVIKKNFSDIPLIFMIASFKLGKENSINKTNYVKCDRCWNYYKDTVKIDENNICKRCHKVLKDE